MGDRQPFPPMIVSPALRRTGGYPFLPAGKATFRNRPIPAQRPPSKRPRLRPVASGVRVRVRGWQGEALGCGAPAVEGFAFVALYGDAAARVAAVVSRQNRLHFNNIM